MKDDADGSRIRRKDLVYPELSYQIVGALYDVHNEIGYGQLEQTYQRAAAAALKERGLSFQEQVFVPVMYKDETVGKKFLDFLIEEKIILELKQGDRYRRENIQQVNAYLQSTGIQLAILANFTRNGLLFRRMVNVSHS